MVGGLGGDVGLGLGVDGSALVGDLSDVAVDVVSSVLHGLDPAVGKGDLVRSRDDTVGIASLSGVEVGLGVVIGNTVGVGVRLRGLLDVDNRGSVVGRGGNLHNRGRGVVGRGSNDNRGRGVVSRGGVDNRGSVVCRGRGVVSRGSVHNRGGMVDGVGHNRGSMDSVVGNCVMGHRVSHKRGSMMHSMVSQRSSVDKRGGVVDGVRNNWGVGNSMVGNRVGDGVDCVSVVSSDNLAVSTMGHSGSASVGEVGAGGSEGTAVVDRLVGGDSGGRLGQAEQGEAHESLHFCSVGVLVGLMSRQS